MLYDLKYDATRYTNSRLKSWILPIIDPGFRSVLLYRFGHWFREHRLRLFAILCEQFMYYLCHCSISTHAEIGRGFLVAHPNGLVIGGNTRIGTNCDVRQHVTFGGNFGAVDEYGRRFPDLGNNISIGAGAAILGPIRIGSESIIGANAVVTRDVPENVIVSGIPAQIVKQRWGKDSSRQL